MRKIKFRGVRIDGTGYAYGDLEHRYSGREIWIDSWQVYPDSVAQLVGYDRYDNEVYEGDTILEAGKYRSTVPHMTFYKYYRAIVE